MDGSHRCRIRIRLVIYQWLPQGYLSELLEIVSTAVLLAANVVVAGWMMWPWLTP